MLLIPCPWCGLREEIEFAFGGSAEHVMPPLDGGEHRALWHEFVHLRANPMGPHRELWFHTHGCERWVEVERDTRDSRILGARDAGSARSR